MSESLAEIVDRETIPEVENDADAHRNPDAAAVHEQGSNSEAPDAVYVEPGLDFEKVRKTLDRENDRHEKRVREIMGDDAEIIEPCPLCQVPGFVFPFTEADPSAEPRRIAVMEYLGGAEPPFQVAGDKQECDRCDGWGQVLTGSKNPLHRVGLCTPCGGTGFVGKVEPMPQPGYVPVPGEVSSPPSDVLTGGHPPDVWARPYGHRDYGIPPALVGG